MSDYPTPGVLSIVGGFLIQLTLGTIVSFGNIVPYMVSYIRNWVPSQVKNLGGGGLAKLVNHPKKHNDTECHKDKQLNIALTIRHMTAWQTDTDTDTFGSQL